MCWRRWVLMLCLLRGLWAGEPILVATKEWTTLNPLLGVRDTDTEAMDLIFDRLVALDAKGNFIPGMLQGWTVLKGGREILLELRPGLTWQDGTPIEAEDLVFTRKAMRLPQVLAIANNAGSVPSFDSVVAEGPLRARIRLSRPLGTLMSDLYNFIPVPRRHYQVGVHPKAAAVNFQPVGSGPYRVLERATTRSLKVERWEGYRGAHPGRWPAFEFSDPPRLPKAKAILEGSLHYAATGTIQHYLARKGQLGKGRLQVFSVPEAAFGAFFINCDPQRSLLGDPALRRALAELIPWQEIARAGRFFPVRLATSFWPPESWAHDPTARQLPQADRASAMLEAAGWQLGPDGFRHDAKGRLLSLLAFQQLGAPRRSLANLLAESAARVGIRMEVQGVPFQDLVDKAAEHDGDLWSFGWTTALDPDVDSPLFTRDGYRTKANVSGYLNPEVDRLFDEGRHTLDPAARKQIYLKLSQIIWRDKPIIPLEYVLSRVLASSRLRGVVFNSLGRSYGFWPGRRGWALEG